MTISFQLCHRRYSRSAQDIHRGFKLNVTHGLLLYADDVNLLRDNINTTNKNTEPVIDTSLGVNTERTKYTLISRHHNARQINNMKIVIDLLKMSQSSHIWE
jgi:hypothetical protein